MSMSYSKSIILVPTLDEKENLEKLIPEIFKLMPEISVLIVDDNSKDGTQELDETLKHNYNNLYPLYSYFNNLAISSIILSSRYTNSLSISGISSI